MVRNLILERGVLAATLQSGPDFLDARTFLKRIPPAAWSDPDHARAAAFMVASEAAPSPADLLATGVSPEKCGELFDFEVAARDLQSTTQELLRTYESGDLETQVAELHQYLGEMLRAPASMDRGIIREMVDGVMSRSPTEAKLEFADLSDWPAVALEDWCHLGQFLGGAALPVKHVSLLSARPGEGKSTLALQWALAVALDRPAGGFTPTRLSSDPQNVLYINAEDPGPVIARRMRAAAAAMRFDDDHLARLVSEGSIQVIDNETCSSRFMDMGGGETLFYRRVLDHVRETSPRLIVLDPLVSLIAGEEDHSGNMDEFVGLCKRLAQASGGAVLVVHHHSKHGARDRGQESARGSSALSGAVRYHIAMAPLSEQDQKRFEIENQAAQFVEASVAKSSYAPKPNGSVILERKDDGILKPANLRVRRLETVAHQLVEAIGRHEANLTRNEISRGQSDTARAVREDVEATRAEIEAALDLAFETGIVTGIDVRGGRGKPRMVVRPYYGITDHGE